MDIEQLADHMMHLPHASLLARFGGLLYTPQLHNKMREVLSAAGVEGDLDAEVAQFVNQPNTVAAYVAKQAAGLRT